MTEMERPDEVGLNLDDVPVCPSCGGPLVVEFDESEFSPWLGLCHNPQCEVSSDRGCVAIQSKKYPSWRSVALPQVRLLVAEIDRLVGLAP